MATNTYVALDKVTVGTATPTVTFTGISGSYTDLVLVSDNLQSGGTQGNLFIQFNSDSGSNYSRTWLSGDGSSAYSGRESSQTKIGLTAYAYPQTTTRWAGIIQIQNYSNTTTYKTLLTRGNNSAVGVDSVAGLWRSTAAITSITISRSNDNFAVGSTFSLYGIKAWAPEATPKATGGYVYSDATYWYHAFPFTSTFTPLQTISCDYLVVAGGGGGSYDVGGAGGAGGLRSTVGATGGGGSLESAISLSATAYTVTVGAGGAGALTGSRTGANGSDSTISSITSIGGGGGGYNGGSGATGGSGGGGSRSSGNGGSGTTNQGYGGGNGASNTNGAGGGGGAGSAGTSANGTTGGGIGGNGVQITALANATLTGINGYYAGGGGGGGNVTPPAAGGLGGGGQGGTPGGQSIKPGVLNTGGGGGGCGGGDSTGNASGGSGLVIIRYAK
jgi:hypothetical protein